VSSQDVMDSSEDEICVFVAASTFPPAFNNSLIVAKYSEVFSGAAERGESADKKLEANSFCPSNVLAFRFPPRDEAPCPPPSGNDDPDSNTRAGI